MKSILIKKGLNSILNEMYNIFNSNKTANKVSYMNCNVILVQSRKRYIGLKYNQLSSPTNE